MTYLIILPTIYILIPRFPSQAPRASSITIRIVTFCEDLANRDDPIRQNKYNHLN